MEMLKQLGIMTEEEQEELIRHPVPAEF